MQNDEIKEIIKETKKLVDNSDYKNCYNYHIFFKVEHIAKLLDYITNLQHTEDLYNQLLKDYDELQQENERLKLEKDTKNASEIICENLHDVYKLRCEKASNLIEPLVEWGECTINGKMLKSVYDILNGKE